MSLKDIYPHAVDCVPYDTDFVIIVDDHDTWGRGVVLRRSRCEDALSGDSTSVAMYRVEDDEYSFEDYEYTDLSQMDVMPEAKQTPLDKRKDDKVQVDLVDRGFPHALWAVAQVMTWAGKSKGYLPHDWKNIPDAEVALEGAASRHRMTHNQQRDAGALAEHCTDHESNLLHKAHEAFNVLAELELIITGKIQ